MLQHLQLCVLGIPRPADFLSNQGSNKLTINQPTNKPTNQISGNPNSLPCPACCLLPAACCATLLPPQLPLPLRCRNKSSTTGAYTELQQGGHGGGPGALADVQDSLVELREYDVPYHIRFAIDSDVRCGHWFTVRCQVGEACVWGGRVPGE